MGKNWGAKEIALRGREFKDLSIAEAFAKVYGGEASKASAEEPINAAAGDVVRLTVRKGTSGVEIVNPGWKEQVAWSTDMCKWEIPDGGIEVDVLVGQKDKRGRTALDPLAGLYRAEMTAMKSGIDTQYSARTVAEGNTVTVKNLRLTNGGYIGDVEMESMTRLTGRPVVVQAFIPGSQIVQNIERDFARWEGYDVEALVMSVSGSRDRRGGRDIDLICSRKALLNLYGDVNRIQLYNQWCDDGDEWREATERDWIGTVTGVINSRGKTGVFVEFPDVAITQLVYKRAEELTRYKPGMEVRCKLTGFHQRKKKDGGQALPYVIEGERIVKVNAQPVFKMID